LLPLYWSVGNRCVALPVLVKLFSLAGTVLQPESYMLTNWRIIQEVKIKNRRTVPCKPVVLSLFHQA
jgi:hypothetical protein